MENNVESKDNEEDKAESNDSTQGTSESPDTTNLQDDSAKASSDFLDDENCATIQ